MFSRNFEHEQMQEPKYYDPLPRVKLIKRNIVPRIGFLRKKVTADSKSSLYEVEETQRFSCPLCPKSKFKARKYLQAHLKNIHQSDVIYCEFPGCQFKTRMRESKRVQVKMILSRHIMNKHCERRKSVAMER